MRFVAFTASAFLIAIAIVANRHDTRRVLSQVCRSVAVCQQAKELVRPFVAPPSIQATPSISAAPTTNIVLPNATPAPVASPVPRTAPPIPAKKVRAPNRLLPSTTPPRPARFPFTLQWMAPFFSGGGYSSESIAFAMALVGMLPLAITQHGDSFNFNFLQGLDSDTRTTLRRLETTYPSVDESVVVCHSEPGAWTAKPFYNTVLCPPRGEDPLYLIGRTMFETDRLPKSWIERCNGMDEIWVPTEHHVRLFQSQGVKVPVIKMAEPVDTDHFTPDGPALSLPIGQRIEYERNGTATATQNGTLPKDAAQQQPFRFLSVFKWEPRKGWDVLLKAYLTEFRSSDSVELYLVTNPFHTDESLAETITAFAREHNISDTQSLPPIQLVDSHVPQSDLPALYRAMDCFVLPSRGEGWGRPHVEAMASGLPVIATNWSGPTEYLTQENGYPLRLDGMQLIPKGAFRTHEWANPSLSHLRTLMRHVTTHPQEAESKGRRARDTMVAHYRPRVMAQHVLDRLAVIRDKLIEDLVL